jgi:pyruvate dehydrogenase E1 component
MYQANESVFYYITVTNQNYPMPTIPDGVEEGIIRGMYAYRYTENADIHLLGSGAIMMEVLDAATQLEELGKRITVWSVTSYVELSRQGIDAERQRMLAVDDTTVRPYVEELFETEEGSVIAASDYQKSLPLSIARWIKNDFVALGTDGYGLSESREALREYFEVSSSWIVFAALSSLARCNRENVTVAHDYAKRKKLDLTKLPPADAGLTMPN